MWNNYLAIERTTMFDIPTDEAGLPLEEAECRDYEEQYEEGAISQVIEYQDLE